MSRVLVCGSTGFIGQHVVKYFEENTDWEIITCDVDLRQSLPPLPRFDYIINLASLSSVSESIKKPRIYIENNIMLALNLLEYARYYPPQLFIQFSTVEAVRPTNPYAASKAAQEAMIMAYQQTYNLPLVVVSSHNIVGEGQSEDKFVPKIAKQIRNGETVSIYKGGSRIYNPVQNICDGLLFILKDPPSPARYYISGGQKLTNLKMAQKIAKIIGEPLKYEFVDAQEARPGYANQLSNSGIDIKTLGWSPPQTEGLSWLK